MINKTLCKPVIWKKNPSVEKQILNAYGPAVVQKEKQTKNTNKQQQKKIQKQQQNTPVKAQKL